MKLKFKLLAIALMMILLTGCGNKPNNTNNGAGTSPTGTTTAPTGTTNNETGNTNGNATPDVVTTASIVDNEAAFENAISNKGTWIIAITKDLTINKDLKLDGEFKNGKKDDKGNDLIQRKVALYSQDENRNITARYTLTAPTLTVTSPEASIQHGTFKGDLYVSVVNFKLIDATVDGNVYFTSEDAQTTFSMDETSKITGKQELKK